MATKVAGSPAIVTRMAPSSGLMIAYLISIIVSATTRRFGSLTRSRRSFNLSPRECFIVHPVFVESQRLLNHIAHASLSPIFI